MTFFFLWNPKKVFWKYVVSSCCFKTIWRSFLCGTQKKKFCKTSWWLFHNGLWLEDVMSKDAKRNNIWVFSSCKVIVYNLSQYGPQITWTTFMMLSLWVYFFLDSWHFQITIHCHRLVQPGHSFKCLLLHFAKLLMPYKYRTKSWHIFHFYEELFL